MKIVFFVILLVQSLVGVVHADLLVKVVEQIDSEAKARVRANDQMANGTKYSSKKKETQFFEGCFLCQNDAKMAIFSDDGCDVSVDGVKVHAKKGQGQHLGDINQSFHLIDTPLKAGQHYVIRVDYSNTIYTGDLDVDGATLFIFPGGGFVSNWEWNHGIPHAAAPKTLALVIANNAIAGRTKINVNDAKWGWYLMTKDHGSAAGNGIHSTGKDGQQIRWEEAWEAWADKWNADHSGVPPTDAEFTMATMICGMTTKRV